MIKVKNQVKRQKIANFKTKKKLIILKLAVAKSTKLNVNKLFLIVNCR